MGLQPPAPGSHWFGTPAPPQLSPAMVQTPQLRVPPQPSPTWPHSAFCCSQVRGVQVPAPHTFGVPAPPQASGSSQVPHWMMLPQPSEMAPQLAPSAPQVVRTQPAPHWFGPAPPHTPLSGHVPQLSEPPQPSPMKPHSASSVSQVSLVHWGWPHWFAVPPPPQESGALQAPQSRGAPPQPSPTWPQVAP